MTWLETFAAAAFCSGVKFAVLRLNDWAAIFCIWTDIWSNARSACMDLMTWWASSIWAASGALRNGIRARQRTRGGILFMFFVLGRVGVWVRGLLGTAESKGAWMV